MKITDLKNKKAKQQKICMLTCYDYPSAITIAETEIDAILVGDSVAMAVHGHQTTMHATLEMMVLHTAAVARGIKTQLIVADLPFLCHRQSRAKTIAAVRQLMVAGAQAIKIEGGDSDTCKTIAYVVNSGIAVFGHIGLTPQSVHQLGGYKVQGKQQEDSQRLLAEAHALQKAGCAALVIECIPESLARQITQELSIPTIGIGAGPSTDGQILVWQDMLGLQTEFKPRFIKNFADCKTHILAGINTYLAEVENGHFPSKEHFFA